MFGGIERVGFLLALRLESVKRGLLGLERRLDLGQFFGALFCTESEMLLKPAGARRYFLDLYFRLPISQRFGFRSTMRIFLVFVSARSFSLWKRPAWRRL